jgi:hypothetical protein
VLDRAVQLADLLDRFAIQVEAVGLDYLLIRTVHSQGEIEARRRRLLKAAVAKLDRAVQVLKRDINQPPC